MSDGVLAGFVLSIGCMICLTLENKIAGAFMFSLGLFAIILFRFALYTGKAGYMVVEPPSYIGEVALVLLGNLMGTALGGLLINLTRLGDGLAEKAQALMLTKMSDSPLSIFVLSIFCGLLMFAAVHGNKLASEKGNFTAALFAVVMPVMMFILCGFNHCIADMGYFFISKCANFTLAPVYFALAILGNAVGCMLILIIKKLSVNRI